MALTGALEESLFLGAHYRQYVRVGGIVVMADSANPRPPGRIRVAIAIDRLQIYGCA